MPRQGDNITRTATGRWEARFKVKITTTEGGTKWVDRSRTFDSYQDAEDHLAQVKVQAARGERWTDQRTIPVPTLGTLVDAWCEGIDRETTRRVKRSYLAKFLAFAGKDTPVTDLTRDLLRRYADSLPSEGRAAATRHRYTLEIESVWRWAHDDEHARFPGVPRPEKLTGTRAHQIKAPPPVTRDAVATVADVDAMIGQLRTGYRHGDAHRRIALLLRYTGIRISQATHLRWSDVRLDHPTPYLVLRAGDRGSKGSDGRAVPLHPALVSEIRRWPNEGTGYVFTSDNAGFRRGDATRDAFCTAWRAAGVDRLVWAAPPDPTGRPSERAYGSPCHGIRAMLTVELSRGGISPHVRDYIVGHSEGATTRAYIPEGAPETSPLWPDLVAAIGTLAPWPGHQPDNEQEQERANVVQLRGQRTA